MIKINLVLVAIAILMLGVMPSVYAYTQDYLKGYKLGKEDGQTGGGGYGSIVCSVSMSNKSCADYVKGYNDGYSSTCGKNPDGCNYILTAVSPDPFYTSGWIDGNKALKSYCLCIFFLCTTNYLSKWILLLNCVWRMREHQSYRRS